MNSDEFARLEARLVREGVFLRQLVADEITDRRELWLIECYETLFRWMESTNAAVDFLLAERTRPQAPKVESPYLNAKEAAGYLRLDGVKKLYGLIERGKLKPLPGSRKLRFTTDILDEYLSGDEP